MSGNPFRSGGQNPYDVPHIDGKPMTGQKADTGGVIYDPMTDAVNPAGAALIASMMKQVDRRIATATKKMQKMLVDAAKVIAEQRKDITRLERALDVKRDAIEDQITNELADYVDGDKPITMPEMKRMAAAHAKKMERIENAEG
ncbi:hypothetical protein [Primorskyibacter sp. S87]|uniref:hypothetical protein n=1 Tax=Primorskyibacter sp. S87 TaxID=3415126 RepID=UPI003C7D05FD